MGPLALKEELSTLWSTSIKDLRNKNQKRFAEHLQVKIQSHAK